MATSVTDKVVVTLLRKISGPEGTVGRLSIEGKAICWVTELPWKHNKRNISCIPDGRYEMALRKSPKYGLVWEVTGVKGRDHILIHAGNFQSETRGCIMPCDSFSTYYDGRHSISGWKSRSSLKTFMDRLTDIREERGMEHPVELLVQGLGGAMA